MNDLIDLVDFIDLIDLFDSFITLVDSFIVWNDVFVSVDYDWLIHQKDKRIANEQSKHFCKPAEIGAYICDVSVVHCIHPMVHTSCLHMYLQLCFCTSSICSFVLIQMDYNHGLGYLRRASLINDSPQGPADCFVGWDPIQKCRFAEAYETGMKLGVLFTRLPKVEQKAMIKDWDGKSQDNNGKSGISKGKLNQKEKAQGKCKVKLNEKEKAQAAAKRAVEKFKKSKDFQKCVHQAAVLLHDKWIFKTMNKMSLMTMNMYSQQKKVFQKSKTNCQVFPEVHQAAD